MVSWQLITLLLCAYGFFKEFKPSEPFLTPYFNTTKHFRLEVLTSEIYPIWTYSYLISLLIVIFVADLLLYNKPLIIIEGAAHVCTRALYVWSSTIFEMQCGQACYGFATATEVAYFSYIYSMLEPSKYQTVTGYARSAVLFGHSISGLIGQLLISIKLADYLILNYISGLSVLVAFVISWALPSVKATVFEKEEDTLLADVTQQNATRCRVFPFYQLWRLFITSYSDHKILMWSVWWSLTMCGYLQVDNYVQTLWSEIANKNNNDITWNGIVDSMATLGGAAVAFSVSKFTFGSQNPIFAEILLGFIALIDALLLVVMIKTEILWIAYLCHVFFGSAYALMITLATLHIASQLKNLGFGLIFGWNTFAALFFQTILTVIVSDKHGLDLGIRSQFIVYACYHGFIAVVFLIRPIWSMILNCIHKLKSCFAKYRLLKINGDRNPVLA